MESGSGDSLEEVRKKGRKRRESGKSPATLAAYRSAWKDFQQWCQENGEEALPADPDTVCDYLFVRNRNLKRSTLRKRLAAIRHFHEKEGHPSPTETDEVRTFWDGLLLMELTRQQSGTVRLEERLDEEKRRLIPPAPEEASLRQLRDRALVLLGIAGDLQRTELVGIDIEDISFEPEAMELTISDEKKLRVKRSRGELPCPVEALERWLKATGIEEGPVFRGVTRYDTLRKGRLRPESVSLIVKHAAEGAGLDPDDYSAEDLRQ